MKINADRQRLDPEIRRVQILEQMLKLCETQHFSSISIRQLATECKMNVALLYHYFNNKECLVHATLRYAIDDFLVFYEDLPKDQSSPLGGADTWFEATIDAAPRLSRMVKLMGDFSAQNDREPEATALVEKFYQRERETLGVGIQKGITEGRFRQVEVERTARLTSLAMDGIFYAGPARNDYDFERNIRDLRNQLLDYLTPA